MNSAHQAAVSEYDDESLPLKAFGMTELRGNQTAVIES
jgi:hypothetical protein